MNPERIKEIEIMIGPKPKPYKPHLVKYYNDLAEWYGKAAEHESARADRWKAEAVTWSAYVDKLEPDDPEKAIYTKKETEEIDANH